MRTGTNLLGLVKHQAAAELGYFGETFGRPFPGELHWDLYARADESREFITDRYRQAWAHADVTISELQLDATGHVPWWPQETNEVSLHQILVHMAIETGRHAGHADIIRELIDGAAGIRAEHSNLAPGDEAYWSGYRDQVERAARAAAH